MEFTINSDFHNARLDTFIRKTYQDIPLSGIFKMIRKGNVKVNKKKRKQNYRLQEGDLVRVWEPSPPTAAKPLLELSGEETKLVRDTIVYEDNDIILCNKPPGLVMHIGSSHEHGLTELVQAYTKNPQFNFVHRIDKMTSGLVLGTKNIATARKFSELIRKRAIEKKYVVLVEGRVEKEQFTLSTFLKTEGDRVRVHPDEKDGAKDSLSEFGVMQHGRKRTLLKATLHTGRKHQLRVQLADIGHPIVGDGKYGSNGKENLMFLFSQCLVIPSLEIHFSIPVPDFFYDKLNQ
jgi:23S rRNA pseudouridine955/2504/2580 synthase